MKKCNYCKQEKPYEFFYKRKQSLDGYDWICKKCKNEKYKKYYNSEKRMAEYERNRDTYLQKGKEYREKNKEKCKESSLKWYRKTKVENAANYLYKYAKARANKKGLEFTITKEDVVIPEFCPILGCRLVIGGVGNSKYSPSIDRIDSSKGYTPDNIQIVSRLYNSMKWDSTREELIHFCKSVLEKEGMAYVNPV
jgi:hypothetical protein